MDSSQRSNKRQRILATEPTKLTDLPTHLVSNCFSYLDPKNEPGHHIFLASVNKDFKAAVEELYQGKRNTSLESILSSPSTCLYVLNLLKEDPTDDIALQTRKKILDAIFESDRLDLYLDALVKVYTLDGFHNNLAFLVRAVQYKSTEIMRSHIDGNDDIIHLLTKFKLPAELNLPEGVEIKASIDESKNFVQSIPAACDPQMIQELVAKGVVFNYMSVLHSLKRNDIETFRCLLDIVRVQKDDEIQSIIIGTLNHHDLRLEAAKCLSKRNYFAQGKFFMIAMYNVITENSDNVMDLVKVFCESKLNLQTLTQREYNLIVYACMSSENMAVLGYLHKSFLRINLELFRQLAVDDDLPDHVADYLQHLELLILHPIKKSSTYVTVTHRDAICELIGQGAFKGNRNLEILNVPKDVELESEEREIGIVDHTKLLESYPFEDASPAVLDWLKDINNIFPLHRVCSSYEPTLEMILDTMKEMGGETAFKLENTIGINASQYLKENPYANVTEKEIIEKYVLQIGGIDQEEEMLQLKKREAEKDKQIFSLREFITIKEHENNALKQEISALKLQLSSENESSENSIIPMKRNKTNESVASMDNTNEAVADLQSENEDLVQQLKIEKSNHLSTIAHLEDARKALKEAYANKK